VGRQLDWYLPTKVASMNYVVSEHRLVQRPLIVGVVRSFDVDFAVVDDMVVAGVVAGVVHQKNCSHDTHNIHYQP
jgi:hypothetical protein